MNIDPRFKKWLRVQAYKHDGKLHREWAPAYLVEETDEYWALASRMSSVIESDGRRWMTKEPAIFMLFKKKWMNVIAMFKEKGGITYYVNIASPTILDDNYLRYIDYDLDVKLYPDLVEKTLDEKEFQFNSKFYGYEANLIQAVLKSKEEVIKMIEKRSFPFLDNEMERLYGIFQNIEPIKKHEQTTDYHK